MKYVKIWDVESPQRANINDSWIDFFVPNNENTIILKGQERVLIPLAIKIELPEWYDLVFKDKSWISSNTWLSVLGWVIDNWYRWELKVCLVNTWLEPVSIKPWQKIV